MKNYYDILEVSEKASQEVIEKAYKALVKKYHPDLQPPDKKKEAEETLKEINEAYSILSDSAKKSDFDRKLNMQKEKEYWQTHKNPVNNTNNTNNTNSINNPSVKANQTNVNSPSSTSSTGHTVNTSKVQKSPSYSKKVVHKPNSQTSSNNLNEKEYKDATYRAYKDAYNNAYKKAYVDNLKRMGYTIKYEKTFKEKLKTFASVIVAIVVLLIVFKILLVIPPTKRYLLSLYNDNELVKLVVDQIIRIFNNIIGLFRK